jgi:hypothetical protein
VTETERLGGGGLRTRDQERTTLISGFRIFKVIVNTANLPNLMNPENRLNETP